MMNHQQMQMAGMVNAGGPVGGQPLMQTGSRGGMTAGQSQLKSLNTYIYDYIIRHGFHDVARAMHKASKLNDNPMPLLLGDGSSPSGRDLNGVDGMDSKEEVKRPADLPEPGNKIGAADSCFLEDWWCQFWDLHAGARGQGGGAVTTYLGANQQQHMLRQRRQNELVANNNMMMYNRMAAAQGGMMPNEMQRAAMMNAKGPINPAMMNNFNRMKLAQQMRDGQNPNMGDQRSQSPNANGDAPSPKRQRMDGAFNGQGMGPAGRGQGMPVQQGNMAGPNGMMLQESFNAQQLQKMNLDAQGSPLPPAAGGDGGNHALQDYQMQLMLLEQQNKKRLLMARQEQDGIAGHPGAMGQQFAPAMSPQGSRQGPSPNPADQGKRGTPQMGQKGLPSGNSPAGMEGVQGNRASPAPPFDPNNMAPPFYPAMNPQMAAAMGRPPSSHPGQYPLPQNMTPQQAAEFARRQQQHGFPTGMIGQPGGQQMGQPVQPGQQPQLGQVMGTPRQPQTNMPPPPAPQAANEQKTNPSSPSQGGPQPPTPSQASKPLPKGKKEKAQTKKGGNKKNQANAAAATPASSEAEPPPTPTSTTTPMHANFKPGSQQAGTAGAQASAPINGNGPGGAVPGPQNPTPQNSGSGIDASAGQPFGDGLGGDPILSLDLASFDSGDVLENFDFDTFLHTDDNGFGDFSNMNFDEAGLTADGS